MAGILLVRVEYNDEQLPLSDVESINITKDSDVANSKSTILLKNPLDQFRSGFVLPFAKHVGTTNTIRFKEGDTVKIYAAVRTDYSPLNTSSGSPDLIFSGEVAEVNVRGSGKSAKVKLTIVDKTYVLLSSIVPKGYFTTSSGKGADDIVIDIVRQVTDNVESDDLSYDASGNLVANGIYAVDARLKGAGGFVEDTRIDGSSFPTLAIARVAKPAYEWLKDLSSTDATNDFAGSDDEDSPTQDRSMLFYLDELNRFHWFYPRDGLTTSLNGSISDSTTTITLADASDFPSSGVVFIESERIEYTGKSSNNLTGCTRGENNTIAAAHSDGVVVTSAISVVEGDTASGHEVLNFNLTKKTFDVVNTVFFSAGSDLVGNGISDYFYDRTTKTKTLKYVHKPYNEISRDMWEAEVSAGNLIKDNSQNDFTYKGNFYRADTYGFTTSWGVDTTGFSDSDYNDSFRDEARRQGKIRAQNLTRKRGSPRWKGTIELNFKRYIAGELMEFTSTRAGLSKQNLRIMKVQYNLRNNGGFVTLSVEEDEAKVGS